MATRVESLQQVLNYAKSRRDSEYNEYITFRNAGASLDVLTAQHKSYTEAKAFLEGVSMAIFAAGYSIITDTEADTQTVTK